MLIIILISRQKARQPTDGRLKEKNRNISSVTTRHTRRNASSFCRFLTRVQRFIIILYVRSSYYTRSFYLSFKCTFFFFLMRIVVHVHNDVLQRYRASAFALEVLTLTLQFVFYFRSEYVRPQYVHDAWLFMRSARSCVQTGMKNVLTITCPRGVENCINVNINRQIDKYLRY